MTKTSLTHLALASSIGKLYCFSGFGLCSTSSASIRPENAVRTHSTLLDALFRIPPSRRQLRERTGLTQEKFAAKLGVTFPTINRRENGGAKPSPLAMQKIEQVLRNIGKNDSHLLK